MRRTSVAEGAGWVCNKRARTDESLSGQLGMLSAPAVPEARELPQFHETDDLSGRYRLYERIGRGVLTNVWQSYDEKIDQLGAIKVPS